MVLLGIEDTNSDLLWYNSFIVSPTEEFLFIKVRTLFSELLQQSVG